jgi:hypothetical protein
MVFPTCASVSTSTGLGTDCSINIAYNMQLPLCTSPTRNKGCRPPEQLCTADPRFSFDLTPRSDNKVRYATLMDNFAKPYSINVGLCSDSYHLNLPIYSRLIIRRTSGSRYDSHAPTSPSSKAWRCQSRRLSRSTFYHFSSGRTTRPSRETCIFCSVLTWHHWVFEWWWTERFVRSHKRCRASEQYEGCKGGSVFGHG